MVCGREAVLLDMDMRELDYLAKKYDETNIPLYLSYPVESFWKENADLSEYLQCIHSGGRTDLYIHLPYCTSICYFCECSKYLAAGEEVNDRYISYIGKELALKFSRDGDRLKIEKMHWGGGTPTYLTPAQIERLFTTILKYTEPENRQNTFSIEAFPDDAVVTDEKLKLLRQLGFQNISYGIQDFDDRVLKTINRSCDRNTVRGLVEKSKALGFDVHVDLCYGLPFQGLNEFEKTLLELVDMEPNVFVLYPYSHFPLLVPGQRRIPSMSIPNTFIKVLCAKLAEDILRSYGYRRIGFDTFAKQGSSLDKAAENGRIIRDFMGSSTDNTNQLIGVGCSAVSFAGGLYSRNFVSMEKYTRALDDGTPPVELSKTHRTDADEDIRNRIIRKYILGDLTINKSRVRHELSVDFDGYFNREKEKLYELERDGIISGVDGEEITFSNDGIYFARHAAYIFDTCYNKHSAN